MQKLPIFKRRESSEDFYKERSTSSTLLPFLQGDIRSKSKGQERWCLAPHVSVACGTQLQGTPKLGVREGRTGKFKNTKIFFGEKIYMYVYIYTHK